MTTTGAHPGYPSCGAPGVSVRGAAGVPPLTPEQLAHADLIAAAHHLTLARDALARAAERIAR